MANLKQNTAYNRAFLIVQSSDHITGLTGAGSTPAVTISKNGAAFGAAAGAVTEIGNGWYYVAFTTADTATLGDLAVHVTVASGDPSDFVDQVTANILGDTLPASLSGTQTFNMTGNITGNLSGSVGSVTAAITLPSIPANWITAAGINAGALNGKGDWLLASSYTAPPSTAAIATGVWTDTTAGDFTVALSVGKSVMNGVALGTGLTVNTVTNAVTLPSIPTNWITAAGINAGALNGKGDWLLASSYTSPPTTAAIATGVWTDTTAGDFTVAASIGKSVMNGVSLGTGLTINGYTGNTPQTGDAYNIIKSGGTGDAAAILTTTNKFAFTVANKVDANILNINGSSLAAQALAQSTQSICWGTCSGGTTTTAVVSTLNNPSSLTDSGQLIGRTIIFLGNSGTANVDSQASNITASGTGATPTITFTAMTHAPANGDVFVVL